MMIISKTKTENKKETGRVASGLRGLADFLGFLAVISLVATLVMAFSDSCSLSETCWVGAGCLGLVIGHYVLNAFAVVVDAAARYLERTRSDE